MTDINLSSLDDHYSMASEVDFSSYIRGSHEVQECLEGESEINLHSYQKRCEKNPGHEQFLPINCISFGCQDNDLYDLIQALADITVRVAVDFTSLGRPEFVPGTKDPYPCYNTRGQNSLRTGTGRVWSVTKYIEGMEYPTYRKCPCPTCDHSDTPSKVWWEVVVRTSKHVVFDSSEARQSSCRLWFDDDKSPVVNIFGWEVNRSDTGHDVCTLSCVTHDVNVADKLEDTIGRFKGLHEKVSDKYKNFRDVDKLTIIVSHPHGWSKQVSVGHWVHRQVGLHRQTRYTYTTCTCPGSSGALVYRLGCDNKSNHPHCGVNSDGCNYSGVYVDFDL